MMLHLERIHSNQDWILPLAILALMVWCVWKIYRRDGAELGRFWRFFLPFLRTLLLFILLVIYLQPQWHTLKEQKVNSRFLVFCDTSLSMTLPNEAEKTESRAQILAEFWEKTPILHQLNEKHDLIFLSLDSEAQVVWSAEKKRLTQTQTELANASSAAVGNLKEDQSQTSLPSNSPTSDSKSEMVSAGQTSTSPNWAQLLSPKGKQSRQADGIREWLLRHSELPISGILLCSDGMQNAGGELSTLVETAQKHSIPIFTLGFGAIHPSENYRLTAVEAPVRIQPSDPFIIHGTVEGIGFQTPENPKAVREIQIDLFQKKISDMNSGTTDSKSTPTPESQADGTRQNGQTPQTKETHLAEEAAQTTPSQETAAAELTTDSMESVLLETLHLQITEEGKQFPFEFKVKPQEVGKYLYSVKIRPGEREQNLEDNFRETEVDVMERKIRVLVFSGGPMREYQFLTASLFRDPQIETDVLLQSALPPEAEMPKNAEEEKALRSQIQQNASQILLKFPVTREELFAYDCIFAIDPNWKVLTPSQVDWIEEWTGRHGGGIVFIAGPVFMGMVGGWMDDPTLQKIRTLCPVEFFDRTSTMRQNTFSADELWPLEWTPAGREAEYLKLDDQASTSESLWHKFPGVYGHFPTRKLRRGATALAHFSNPQARMGETPPILLATQFYGAGRAFYLGTGEFWRLRAQNPEFFTRFYVQILRYVTQGRTLQQSLRGRLMLEQSKFFPGDPIEIRAQLFDAALQPIDALQMPETEAELFLPNGKIQNVRLQADRSMPGLFTGRIAILEEGRFRLELPIPDSPERLIQRGEIILSDLERAKPQRDQLFLESLAHQTGGENFTNPAQPEILLLPEKLRDKTRTLVTEIASTEPVIPLKYLLGALAACLFLEWTLRRLLKLA